MSFSVIQTIMGMIGSVGFAVLFGVRGRKLAVIALGSGAGWAVYLVCRAMGCSIFTGLLAASLFVAALSEVLARMLRTPVILLLVPMLIPEVPGEALYYTMLLSGAGISGRIWNLLRAGAHRGRSLALGIILASHMARFFISLKSHLRSRGNKKRGIEQEDLEFMKYVYASRSGNVEELVHVLGLEADEDKGMVRKPWIDFILFTYTVAEALCRLL